MHNCHLKTCYVTSINLDNLICRQIHVLVIFYPVFLWMFLLVSKLFLVYLITTTKKEINTKSLKLTRLRTRLRHTQLLPLEN